MPVYGSEGNGVTVYYGLNDNSILNFIAVKLIDETQYENLRKGDEITVVALLEDKIAMELLLVNGYLENVVETENTITDEIIVIDDYIDFYNNYSQLDIGKIVQITAPIHDAHGTISITEGLLDGITSMIVCYDIPDEELEGISEGDIVTVVGRCESKLGKALTMSDCYIVHN